MAELSGFEVLALAKEIDFRLRGTYVNNIYSLGAAQVLRLRKADGADEWLLVSSARGVWVSGRVTERGETTPFTTRLRGELDRARFQTAGQVDLDRVFKLGFTQGKVEKTLIIEMMPPGNVIVAGPDSRVLLAEKEVRTQSRRVVKGETYSPPAQRRASPKDVSVEDLEAFVAAETTAGRVLGRHVALPRKYVAEALQRAGVSEGSPSESLRGRERGLKEALDGILEEARTSPKPCLCGTADGGEVYAVRPSACESPREFGSMSELCDEVLFEPATAQLEAKGVPDELARHEATLRKLEEEGESLAARAKALRETARKAGASADAEEAVRALRDGGVAFRAPPTSPSAAASVAYDSAKVIERKIADIRETTEKLAKAPPKRARRSRGGAKLATRRQEWFEKFRWFFTSTGKLAVGGRDAGSNSTLIRRHLSSDDVVFHADLFGSPFFVLKGGGEMEPDDEREVASATASFSSAWKTGLAAADAYWVRPDQVSAAAPSGEFLARGSFAIRGKKNYVTKVQVEVAVGVDGSGRVAAGPEGAISKTCSSYLVLRPAREKTSDTAKKVWKALDPEGGRVTLDEVLRALPAGGGRVGGRGPVSPSASSGD